MRRRSSASICGTFCESASSTQKLSTMWCSSSRVCSFLMRRYSDFSSMMTINMTTTACMMTKMYRACCLPCSLPFKLLSQLDVKAWPRHCLLISLTPACACRPTLSVWQSCSWAATAITLCNHMERLACVVNHAARKATIVLLVCWKASEPIASL